MDIPSLSLEQINYFAAKLTENDDLLEGVLSFIRHEVYNKFVSKETLAQDIKKSRTVASKILNLLEGMTLINVTYAGMPRTCMAVLNENGREVVKKLVDMGVLEITEEGVKRVGTYNSP
ncbi:hypothetical protein [Zhaonella formicivorans]|uniref:hypothetical protein n=1 Tax=Zhaonella formicivorans TaxID=2528593 RepID=UPI0010D4C840|nr:hypothetical protein [Zhaonella formicivorans]